MVKLTDKNFHDSYVEHGELEVGSDRGFAWVMTGAGLVFGLAPMVLGGDGPVLWLLGLAGVFFGFGVIAPRVLHPLNVLWMKLALVLNKIVSPLVLGLLFFVTITPMALLVRLAGKDLLSLKLEKDAKSYWIDRAPPGPPPETMKNQF